MSTGCHGNTDKLGVGQLGVGLWGTFLEELMPRLTTQVSAVKNASKTNEISSNRC